MIFYGILMLACFLLWATFGFSGLGMRNIWRLHVMLSACILMALGSFVVLEAMAS